jgi:hypothetical protein
MPFGMDLLSTTRLTARIQTLENTMESPDSLFFERSVPTVDAEDGDIMASFENRVVIADIVLDDQAAVVRSGGRYILNTSAIPNIKTGRHVTQSMMRLLRRINANATLQGEATSLDRYVRQETANALMGIRQMRNAMVAGMMMDNWSYRKGGAIFNNVSWGMPSTHKIVPSVPWDNPAATPASDLLGLLAGWSTDASSPEQFDTLLCGRTLFNKIITSEDFRTQAANFFAPAAPANATFPSLIANLQTARTLFNQITGLNFVQISGNYVDEMNSGSSVVKPYVPDNIAIVTSLQYLNNQAVMDFANGVVSESEVGTGAPTVIGGGFTLPERGPVSYATYNPDLNPPNYKIWAVQRGFPRKHRATATAVITAWPALY